eukprot:323241-Rhodomonas_salina.1
MARECMASVHVAIACESRPAAAAARCTRIQPTLSLARSLALNTIQPTLSRHHSTCPALSRHPSPTHSLQAPMAGCRVSDADAATGTDTDADTRRLLVGQATWTGWATRMRP